MRWKDTLLAACLWLVRILTVGLALAVLLALVWLWRTTPNAPGGDAPAAAREAKPRPAPAAAAAAAPPEREEPRARADRRPLALPAVTGPTPFVRRLAAGDALKALRAELAGSDPEELLAAFASLHGALLYSDGKVPVPGTLGELRSIVAALTDPACDRTVLRLHGGGSEAEAGPVRVWTFPPEGVDGKEVRRATRMVEQIAAAAGDPLDGGFDVLVTPKRGDDVFRRQPVPLTLAIGVYFPADGYCAVVSELDPIVRGEVIKHELVHALMYRVGISGSSFVTEGLAEYLRYVEPDAGLAVPPRRFAHNLALLALILDHFDASGFQPARLVELSPFEFYALGGLGYLVAQAAMAYIGGDPIALALRERSERAIVEAVEAVEGAELLRFVRENGERGVPRHAVTVEDGHRLPGPRGLVDTVLRDVRVRARDAIGLAPRGPVAEIPLDREGARDPDDLLDHEQRIADVMARVLDEPGACVLVTDRSPAMDRPIRVGEPPRALGPGFDPRTPRELVALLHARLSGQRRLEVRGLGPGGPRGGRELLDAVTPYALDLAPTETPLVVCVASASDDPEALARLAARVAEFEGRERIVALVVDLAVGDGDALGIARVLARHGGRVAYWDPLLREEGR